MTIGELVGHIAFAGRALQRANPDLSLDDFHAIEIVVRGKPAARDPLPTLRYVGLITANNKPCLVLDVLDPDNQGKAT